MTSFTRATGRGRFVLVVATALLMSLLLALPAAAQDQAKHPAVPQLVWSDCDDGFECATAQVPLDYDDPVGVSISLALIRLPATEPNQRIGSLFVNPGGPGNSGVQYVRESARSVYPSQVQARFDIVGMDPRGVASSTPVRCFDSDEEQQAFFADYDVLPVGQAALDAAVAKTADLARRCDELSGWLLDHLSTANVARDLDLLRRAVGDDGLTYAGYSYGTYLGATYAAMFPRHVRAMALDANSDPTAYGSGPRQTVPFVRVGAHLGSSETLDQFFALCAAAGPRCDFAAGGDPATKFATLAQRLLAAPLVLPDGRRIGYAELVDFTIQNLYRATDYAFSASILEQLYQLSSPTPSTQLLASLGSEVPSGSPAAGPSSNVREALFASVCGETANPDDGATFARAAARADRQAPYVGSFWAYLTLPCASWAALDDDRWTGPWRVRLRNPALVLTTRFDPATPARNARTMASLLIGSRIVTVEGWGHTARDTASMCADAIVERYLVTTALPRRDITCDPGVVPFAP